MVPALQDNKRATNFRNFGWKFYDDIVVRETTASLHYGGWIKAPLKRFQHSSAIICWLRFRGNTQYGTNPAERRQLIWGWRYVNCSAVTPLVCHRREPDTQGRCVHLLSGCSLYSVHWIYFLVTTYSVFWIYFLADHLFCVFDLFCGWPLILCIEFIFWVTTYSVHWIFFWVLTAQP